MKETIRNLKKVYEIGKDCRKNMIIFCLLSLIFIFVNIIYPIFTARQLTNLTGGFFDMTLTVRKNADFSTPFTNIFLGTFPCCGVRAGSSYQPPLY